MRLRHEESPCLAEGKSQDLGPRKGTSGDAWSNALLQAGPLRPGCSGLCSGTVQISSQTKSPNLCEPWADHPHGESLVLISSSPSPLGLVLPLCTPSVPCSSPLLPAVIGHFCRRHLASLAARRLQETMPKAMARWRASCALSKLRASDQVAGERLGSRQAGFNVNASAWNAKSRRPKGKEKGFSEQGSKSVWGGRGQAKRGLMLRSGKGKPLTGILRCRGHSLPQCISLDQSGCAVSTGERAMALPGIGLRSLERPSSAGRPDLAALSADAGRAGSRRA